MKKAILVFATAFLSVHSFATIKTVNSEVKSVEASSITINPVKEDVNGVTVSLHEGAVKNILLINTTSTETREVNVRLFDTNGKVLEEQKLNLEKGQRSIKIDMNRYEAGKYKIMVKDLKNKKQSTYGISKVL